MVFDFDDLNKLAEPFSVNCPVYGRVCEGKAGAGFFHIYFHGDTMCSQYPPAAEHRVHPTAFGVSMLARFRRFVNFIRYRLAIGGGG